MFQNTFMTNIVALKKPAARLMLGFIAILTLVSATFGTSYAQERVEFFSSTNFFAFLFDHGNIEFPGQSVSDLKNISLFTVNNWGQLIEFNPNDDIESIRVPIGNCVTVYEDAIFSGKFQSFSQSVNDLGGLRNRISSIVVTEQCPTGFAELYKHSNFEGWNMSVFPGMNVSNLKSKGDKISSLKIPTGVCVTLYKDDMYSGNFASFDRDVNRLRTLHDEASSVAVTERCPNANEFVELFKHRRYGGWQMSLFPGMEISDLERKNDEVSSLRIPNGVCLEVFQHKNFLGQSRIFSNENITDLKRVRWQNDNRMGDTISSLKVTRC